MEDHTALHTLIEQLPTIPDSDLPEASILKMYTKSAKSEFDIQFPADQRFQFAEIVLDKVRRHLFEGGDLTYPIIGVTFVRQTTKEYVSLIYDHTTGKNKISKRNRRNQPKCVFSNQITFVIRPSELRRPINIKLFNNSRMTMTGVLRDEDGSTAVDILRREMMTRPDVFTELDRRELLMNYYSIYMIVADFRTHFPVNREKIRDIITAEPYNLFCIFDPDTNYSGAKLCYYWNAANESRDGQCHCRREDGLSCIEYEELHPKKRFDGFNGCRCITIAVFQSGCILIQGACSNEQVIDAYNFFKEFMRNHWRELILITLGNFRDIRRILGIGDNPSP
jgi:hypothetical protein